MNEWIQCCFYLTHVIQHRASEQPAWNPSHEETEPSSQYSTAARSASVSTSVRVRVISCAEQELSQHSYNEGFLHPQWACWGYLESWPWVDTLTCNRVTPELTGTTILRASGTGNKHFEAFHWRLFTCLLFLSLFCSFRILCFFL